jgi:uroporphyrinogen-III synthase
VIPVIVIRPEPGCAATVTAARKLGLEALAAPLFAVAPREWAVPEEPCDAVLAGSANAFRRGGPQLAALTALPVHAVGQATAEAAKAAGFTVANTGTGGLQELLETLTPPQHLLRLAGAERVPLELPAGLSLTERVVYAAEPRALDPALIETLRDSAVVLLHSAAAARHFAAECARLALPRERIALAAIGPRVVEACGAGWRAVASADAPNDTALLALARRLCQ